MSRPLRITALVLAGIAVVWAVLAAASVPAARSLA